MAFSYEKKMKINLFLQFLELKIENLISVKIISLFTHNGGEYIGLISSLNQNGINHRTSPPNTSEHNGIP